MRRKTYFGTAASYMWITARQETDICLCRNEALRRVASSRRDECDVSEKDEWGEALVGGMASRKQISLRLL